MNNSNRIIEVLTEKYPTVNFEIIRDRIVWVDGVNQLMVENYLVSKRLFNYEYVLDREITDSFYQTALKQFWLGYGLPVDDLPISYNEFCTKAPNYSWGEDFKGKHGFWVRIIFDTYIRRDYQEINLIAANFKKLMAMMGCQIPESIIELIKKHLQNAQRYSIDTAGELLEWITKDLKSEKEIKSIYFSEEGLKYITKRIKEII